MKTFTEEFDANFPPIVAGRGVEGRERMILFMISYLTTLGEEIEGMKPVACSNFDCRSKTCAGNKYARAALNAASALIKSKI